MIPVRFPQRETGVQAQLGKGWSHCEQAAFLQVGHGPGQLIHTQHNPCKRDPGMQMCPRLWAPKEAPKDTGHRSLCMQGSDVPTSLYLQRRKQETLLWPLG